ncbi:RHS repeat-associated core domain-containing protein, partial [Chitinimonas viridis]
RLGSLVAITGADGSLKDKLAYDAWGKRRNLNGSGMPDELGDGKVIDRGFTGHEMLDELDLVHMNGRIYDPLVARFLSADPLIQDPEHSQSYNRYTYVWNNPTNMTDPTGFAADDVRREKEGDDDDDWIKEVQKKVRAYCRGSADLLCNYRTSVTGYFYHAAGETHMISAATYGHLVWAGNALFNQGGQSSSVSNGITSHMLAEQEYMHTTGSGLPFYAVVPVFNLHAISIGIAAHAEFSNLVRGRGGLGNVFVRYPDGIKWGFIDGVIGHYAAELKSNACLAGAACLLAAQMQLDKYTTGTGFAKMNVMSEFFSGEPFLMATGTTFLGQRYEFTYNPGPSLGLVGYSARLLDTAAQREARSIAGEKSREAILREGGGENYGAPPPSWVYVLP